MEKKMNIKEVDVTINGNVETMEVLSVIAQAEQKIPSGRELASVIITEAGDNLVVDWATKPERFERIRRITGYLVGTVDRWNNGKQAELRDRVKHF